MKYNQQIVATATAVLASTNVLFAAIPATAQLQQEKINRVAPTVKLNQTPGQQSLSRHIWDVSTLVFSGDAKKLISGSFDETIQIWDLNQGKLTYSLPGHRDGVNVVVLTPDGKTLISAGGAAQTNTDKGINVWDIGNIDKSVRIEKRKKNQRVRPIQRVKKIRTLAGHSQGITALALSPDGKTLFSASYDKTIKQWDLTTGQLVRSLANHGSWIRAIAVSDDGKTLVSGGGSLNDNSDTKVRVWNLETGQVTQTLEGTPDSIGFVGYTADKQKIIAGSETTINIWDGNNYKLSQTIQSPSPEGFKSFAINPNSQTLATTSLNGAVNIWNLNNGKMSRTIVPAARNQNFDRLYPSAILFSPDGNQLAVGHGGGAELKNFPIDIRKL